MEDSGCPLSVEVLRQIIMDVLDEEDFTGLRKAGQKRQRQPHQSLEDSPWGRLLRDPSLLVEGSFVNRKFRRRFCVCYYFQLRFILPVVLLPSGRFRIPPRLFFDVLVPMCESKNVFQMKHDGRIPIQFKIMVALRILGRGVTADDIEELSGIGESTALSIFKTFVKEFSKAFLEEYVHFPVGDELLKCMEIYRVLGVPGALGSADCTHVRLGKCPEGLRWLCKGKEDFPTLSFLVIVDHNRKALYVSSAHFGASNDITISKNDPMLLGILAGKFADTEFVLYDEDGIPTLCKGAYLITDNGFPPSWPCMVSPFKDAYTRDDVLWSEWIESIRKDVECFFGVLKSRFRFLMNAIQYGIIVIDEAFKTCCILHNMLLAYDGLDAEAMTREDFWNALDPELSDEYTLINHDAIPTEAEVQAPASFGNVIDMYQLAENRTLLKAGTFLYPQGPKGIRELLTTHFTHQYRISDLWWPKGFGRKQRLLFDIPRVTKRTATILSKSLYTKDSDFTTAAGASIGKGLFSTLTRSVGDNIVNYVGDVISAVDYEGCVTDGLGGYAIRISATHFLDCYKYKNTCKASMCNDFHNLRHKTRPRYNAASNVKIVVDARRRRAWLEAITPILANTELLTDYGEVLV